MRFVIFAVLFLLSCVGPTLAGDGHHNDLNGKQTDVFDVFYRHLGANNNRMELTDLERLLEDLHFKKCHQSGGDLDCNTVSQHFPVFKEWSHRGKYPGQSC